LAIVIATTYAASVANNNLPIAPAGGGKKKVRSHPISEKLLQERELLLTRKLLALKRKGKDFVVLVSSLMQSLGLSQHLNLV
jgi:hypothetical protein